MSDMIERYVYDVARRLPEKEREDVRRELAANIFDMLPDNPTQEEIHAVLLELGDPAKLAERYRQNPRYLISPAMYDHYVRAVKWVTPLVGVILLAVGMVLGAIDAISAGEASGAKFISSIISRGISTGVSAAVQALVWTTVGFVIAERTRKKVLVGAAAGVIDIKTPGKGGEPRPWTPGDLPPVPESGGAAIPLSDCIAELVITVIFAIFCFLGISGRFPFALSLQSGDIYVTRLFSPEFLRLLAPAVGIMAAFGIAEAALKLAHRKWSVITCSATVVSGLVSMGVILYLFTRADIFSAEFTAFIESVGWGSLDLLSFMGRGVSNPVAIIVCVIVVVTTIVTCVGAVRKTVRAYKA